MALAHRACRDGCIAHATIELWVDEQFQFTTSKALFTLYTEAVAPAGCWDYNICLEDERSNLAASYDVEMPSYGHAFHRKCITKWFS